MKRLLALLSLWPALVLADVAYVSDVEWDNGGDSTIDLSTGSDLALVVVAIDEGTDHSDVVQGTVNIDTTDPETMTKLAAESGASATWTHQEVHIGDTAKTSATTPIDTDFSTDWMQLAVLFSGADASAIVSDNYCIAPENSFTTDFGCQITTVPAGSTVLVCVQTETTHGVSSWKESATEREYFNGSGGGDTLQARCATKDEASARSNVTYGADFSASEIGNVFAVAIPPASGGSPTISFGASTQNIDVQGTATLSEALASGNPTHLENATTGNRLSCETPTSTTCPFTPTYDMLETGEALVNTKLDVADDWFVTNDTDDSQTAELTIAAGPALTVERVDLTCDPDTPDDCIDATYALPGMDVNDDVLIKVLTGTLIQLGTEGDVNFEEGGFSFIAARYDEDLGANGAYLAQEDVIVIVPAGGNDLLARAARLTAASANRVRTVQRRSHYTRRNTASLRTQIRRRRGF